MSISIRCAASAGTDRAETTHPPSGASTLARRGSPSSGTDAFQNPRGRGLASKIVSEPLQDPPAVIDLIRLLP